MPNILLTIFFFLIHPLIVLGDQVPNNLGHGYEFENNGKARGHIFSKTYEKNNPEFPSLNVSKDLSEGIKRTLQYLKRSSSRKTFKSGNLTISGRQLIKAAEIIDAFAKTGIDKHLSSLGFFQIKGEDGKGNVHFTGYFTPLLEAREKADEVFKYPIYAMPKSRPIPTRQAIDSQNALAGKGLELAFTSNLLDNFFLSVQGSGILKFADGKQKSVGYAGSNGHPYRSVGKMLIKKGAISPEKISLRSIEKWFEAHPEQLAPILNKNPSYSFFKWRRNRITGATGLPLSPMHSVAVDKSYIPYGACLIAEVPLLDENGSYKCHQWRILFAHDTGGAIRGPGHLDLYHGQGREAGFRAGDLHHYGRVWLILPKE